jgi:peptidoglycan/xylan/chitin deacetylase (PgdA/CDA1 family)
MPETFWPHGARGAVSLSYDDAMPCHRELVAPALEAHGLHGTFYAPYRDDLVQHTAAWRAMAAAGHELGNHSLFHPCRRERPVPDDWLAGWNNLCHFDPDRLRGELGAANFMLSLLDGRAQRTYGNTCHDVWIGPPESRQRIEPLLAQLFVAARGECLNRPSDPLTADLFNLGTTGGDGGDFAQWQAQIEQAEAVGGYLLLTFHGVGEGLRRLQVDSGEHQRLLAWLQASAGEIWTAPVVEVAGWIRDRR